METNAFKETAIDIVTDPRRTVPELLGDAMDVTGRLAVRAIRRFKELQAPVIIAPDTIHIDDGFKYATQD